VHPALALVPVVPFMPHATHDSGFFADPLPRARDTLSRFARWWTLPVQGVLFLFGLVNAGVPLHGLEPGMWALPVATLVGRPLGILVGAELAVAAGLHRTPRVGWKELLVVGCTASIGLAVALFFATAVMPLGPLLLQIKTGSLLTAAGAGLAFLAAWLLGVGRFAATAPVSAPGCAAWDQPSELKARARD
jgi:NhaA family Na+:H+ antiporter